MKCPECKTVLSNVLETRTTIFEIRRRRQCYNGHRFTTVETLLQTIEREPRAKKSAVREP